VDRIHAIQGYGAQVELALRMVGAAFLILLWQLPKHALSNVLQELQQRVAEKEKEGWTFVHPFDDPRLFEGYGTVGMFQYSGQQKFSCSITM
jgi:threonine dehydratase